MSCLEREESTSMADTQLEKALKRLVEAGVIPPNVETLALAVQQIRREMAAQPTS